MWYYDPNDPEQTLPCLCDAPTVLIETDQPRRSVIETLVDWHNASFCFTLVFGMAVAALVYIPPMVVVLVLSWDTGFINVPIIGFLGTLVGMFVAIGSFIALLEKIVPDDWWDVLD